MPSRAAAVNSGKEPAAMDSLVNIQSLVDDARCFETVRRLRWPEGVQCPPCTATSTLDTGEGYGLVTRGCRLPTLGQHATVLGPVKHEPLARGPAALLERPCARRPASGQVGTAGWSAFGRTSGWIMPRPCAG